MRAGSCSPDHYRGPWRDDVPWAGTPIPGGPGPSRAGRGGARAAGVGAAEASGWYARPVCPELRSSAPGVMEDMIEARVRLPEALGGSLPSSAPQLVEMLHAAAGAGEPVVVSAVGTSGHSARAVAQ